MPQRGVSRRVSVRFDEVGDEGKIAAEAEERLDKDEQMLTTSVETPPVMTEPPVIEITRRTDDQPSRLKPTANRLEGAWDESETGKEQTTE